MENSKLSEVVFWGLLPFRVLYSLIRDEYEFWTVVKGYTLDKPLKDAFKSQRDDLQHQDRGARLHLDLVGRYLLAQ